MQNQAAAQFTRCGPLPTSRNENMYIQAPEGLLIPHITVDGSSARGQRTGIHQIPGVSFKLFVRSVERGAWESHQTRPRRFEDAEGADEFHERVDPGGFGGAVGWSIVSTGFEKVAVCVEVGLTLQRYNCSC